VLSIPGYDMDVELVHHDGHALKEFRKKHDALLANSSDFGALTVKSQVPTKHATAASSKAKSKRPWRAMYWFESEIGKGAFGVVHKVRRLQDWKVFAAKELINAGETDRARFKEEMRAMRRLRHERIVAFQDWYADTERNW
jgi:hypothetical protein